MALKTIRLELARTREFPAGSSTRGYEFAAPLTEEGYLDTEAWPSARRACRVVRFWENEDDRVGELHHTRHRTWAFSYQPGEEDDEAFYRIEGHVFRVGEYVTITEQDGQVLTFKVVSVQ
ncbi:MAG: hypothetical protein FJX56_10195 [Alphaproteobacteria bacterium]|nr:hypothetical protein [Alphaproteobacteria bacterium]